MNVRGINISFARPVEIPEGIEHAISCLVTRICDQNCEEDHVHWQSGTGIGRMEISPADAALIGDRPSHQRNATIRNGDEPEWVDDGVLYMETCYREAHEKEIGRPQTKWQAKMNAAIDAFLEALR